MVSIARRSGVFASVLALAAAAVVAQSASAAQPLTVQGKAAPASVKMTDPASPGVIHRFPPTVIHRFPFP